MNRNLALEMTRITEAAALHAARFLGKGEPKSASQSAASAMAKCLESMDFMGKIIIGAGNEDETGTLYHGQTIGCQKEPEVDIVLDPLECIDSVAYSRPNAMSAIAIAPKNSFFKAPPIYMEKIAVGPEAAHVIDIGQSLEENVNRVARAKNYSLADLTIVILDRARHQDIINRLRKLGTRIRLIPDGDVSAAIATSLPGTGIDMLVGTGGAPEGVLSAAAMLCLGGEIQCRFTLRNKSDETLLKEYGINNFNKIYKTGDLTGSEDIMFAATGITDGDVLNGVRYRSDGATTNSLVIRSSTKTRRFLTTEHYFENQPQY